MGLNQISSEQEINVKIEAYKRGHYTILDLFDKQIDALSVLNDDETDDLIYGGAAGGGKSWLGCEWLLWNCLAYPETRWYIGRDNKQQIRNSTVVTFRKVCKKHKIPLNWWKYDNQTVKITFANGSIIDGLQLHYQPSDPEYDELGSTEYSGGFIEEGGGVHVKAKEVLSVRIGRHNNDRYNIRGKTLITANPSKNWIYKDYYKPFKDGNLPKNKKFIQSLITDNSKREKGYLEKLQSLKGAARERLLDGNWEFDNDPYKLCEYEAILDLFTNNFINPNGEKALIADIAGRGSDESVLGAFDGDVLIEYKIIPLANPKEIEDSIKELLRKHRIPNSRFVFDADGVGWYLGGYIKGSHEFINGSSPKPNKDTKSDAPKYENLKTQCEYMLAERINKRQLYLEAVKNPTEQEKFIEEISVLKRREVDNDKVLKTLTKAEIKVILGRSPDRLDMLKMKEYLNLLPKQSTFKYY